MSAPRSKNKAGKKKSVKKPTSRNRRPAWVARKVTGAALSGVQTA